LGISSVVGVGASTSIFSEEGSLKLRLTRGKGKRRSRVCDFRFRKPTWSFYAPRKRGGKRVTACQKEKGQERRGKKKRIGAKKGNALLRKRESAKSASLQGGRGNMVSEGVIRKKRSTPKEPLSFSIKP